MKQPDLSKSTEASPEIFKVKTKAQILVALAQNQCQTLSHPHPRSQHTQRPQHKQHFMDN